MMSEAQTFEQEVLEGLRRIYEDRGMRFISHPPREVIPQFLGGYEPDALALGPDGGAIIEIKLRRQPKSDVRLADISERVAKQPGWEFRVVYANERPAEATNIPRPTSEQIHGKVDEITNLIRSGHYESALVLCWAVLESLARLAVDTDGSAPAKAISPHQTIDRLAMHGYIGSDLSRRLRDMVRLRNSAVHGDFATTIGKGDVEFLLAEIRTIQAELADHDVPSG
jgi:hypothetical protein